MNLQWENKVDNEDFVSAEDINAVANAIIKLQEDFEKNKMSEIDQTYNPESENAQSGKAVAEAVAPKMDKFADVTIEKQGNNISKIILGILKNAITGDYEVDGITPAFELISDPYNNGDFVKLVLRYGVAELASRYIARLSGDKGNAKVEALCSDLADINLLNEYNEGVEHPYPVSQITADIVLVRDNNGNPIRILNVADPIKDLDVANKRYVDRVVKPQKQTFTNGETITITDNTEYIASEEITNLTIIYPDTDFICSFNFTLASTGDITITLPESKYIGSVPSFANGETWELNIKNGVVVGGKVE